MRLFLAGLLLAGLIGCGEAKKPTPPKDTKPTPDVKGTADKAAADAKAATDKAAEEAKKAITK